MDMTTGPVHYRGSPHGGGGEVVIANDVIRSFNNTKMFTLTGTRSRTRRERRHLRFSRKRFERVVYRRLVRGETA